MREIPLQAIANQEFNIVLDSNQWNIKLKTTEGCISVSLTLNNEVVIENAHAAAGVKIIPANYLENGNFLFLTSNFQLPDYTQFGITQRFLYFSAEELAVLREPVAPPITAAFFNPIADLPLRFQPSGYILVP